MPEVFAVLVRSKVQYLFRKKVRHVKYGISLRYKTQKAMTLESDEHRKENGRSVQVFCVFLVSAI